MLKFDDKELRFGGHRWKHIPIDSGDSIYLISDDGQVFNMDTRSLLKPCKQYVQGRYYVKLKDGNSKRKNYFIHRLVAEAFIPNPHGLETVNHINEDKTDNRVENLEWMTRKDNLAYGTRAKRIGDKLRGIPKSYFKQLKNNKQ